MNSPDSQDSPDGPMEHQFVNVTENPSLDKDKRRIHVRRTVMAQYHKQRKRQKQKAEKEAEKPKEESLTPSTSVSSPTWIRRPTHLLCAKPWANEHQARASDAVINYLCGQAIHGITDLSGVLFVHSSWKNGLEVTGTGAHPLLSFQQILGYYGDKDFMHIDQTPLWDAVHMEQETIYTQCEDWEPFRLLGAAQAITLYLLLRVRTGANHPVFPDGDIALLFTLSKVFKSLQDGHMRGPTLGTILPQNDEWEQWIFRESVMRTAMIYFLLDLTVNVDFGLTYDRPTDWHLHDMPLPCTKDLWLAEDMLAWKEKCPREGYIWSHSLTFGHMYSHSDIHKRRLQTWQESSDELGLVVTLASQLDSPTRQK
ncbi:hypothetical protein B0I35DRAFT_444137 [Stachybotrys elegans]|uniref:Transcription factor domain-containing protein n=1 Tax=Stachybotrys elegans TaxID=80388 RepID=A0A8K0SE79_9HYPO|nr:hypothetical protein B0I35DRAFT_444137 [Stachybotrys elegans]